MQSNKGSLAWILGLRKHFDTSGKSPALLQHRAIFGPPMALPNRPSGAIAGKKSLPTIEVARPAIERRYVTLPFRKREARLSVQPSNS
jgi:hypothetical protein